MQFALECCEMSYQENVTIFKGYPCKLIQSSEDAQAYIFNTELATVITFRGTSSWMDAISDFDAVAIPFYKTAKVHRGFFEQYESLFKQLQENLPYKERKILLFGHSLGGALSQIAALDLNLHGYENISCIHFGSPRVGNKAFATLLSEKVPDNLAIVHRLDPIPQLPSFLGWWKHPTTKRLEISKNVLFSRYEDTNSFSFNFWSPSKAHSLKSYKENLIYQEP